MQVAEAQYHARFSAVSMLAKPIEYGISNLSFQIAGCKCQDPKDKIYAVLSISQNDPIPGIVPDYTKSTEEIYKDATVRYISRLGCLGILAQCGRYFDPDWQSQLSLPGWVPDWSFEGMSWTQLSPDLSPSCLVDGGLSAPVQVLKTDILRVLCVPVVAVRSVIRVGVPSMSLEACITTLAKLQAHPGLDRGYLQAHPTILSRLLVRGIVADDGHQDHLTRLTLQTVADVLNLVKNGAELKDMGPAHRNVLSYISQTLFAFRVFTSEEGHMGIAPRWAEAADMVTIILGCRVPLLLRRSTAPGEQYRIVGPCYMPDLQSGEKLLGPLSEDDAWQQVVVSSAGISMPRLVLMNLLDGSVLNEDPRLSKWFPESLMADYREKRQSGQFVVFKVDLAKLEAMGVTGARYIDLI